MKLMLNQRLLTPIALIFASITLAGCVDDGRYYNVETRITDSPRYDRRDGGPRYYPPRDSSWDRDYRREPPRRDYPRAYPPSIYDDRGYRRGYY